MNELNCVLALATWYYCNMRRVVAVRRAEATIAECRALPGVRESFASNANDDVNYS